MVYFDRALTWTTRKLVSHFRQATEGVEFDTIIGTGLSGTIFVARVADTMGKSFGILRKPDDDSTHSMNSLEGSIGERWLFVDDFTETGDTFKRTLKKISRDFPGSVFVGAYFYEADSEPYRNPEYLAEKYGDWVRAFELGPLNGPQTLEHYSRAYPYQIELTWPPGGFEDRVKPLVKLPADLEVSYDDYDGNPCFWSPSCYTSFNLEDYPQLRPIISHVRRLRGASWYSPGMYQNRKLRDIPEMAACVPLLDSK